MSNNIYRYVSSYKSFIFTNATLSLNIKEKTNRGNTKSSGHPKNSTTFKIEKMNRFILLFTFLPLCMSQDDWQPVLNHDFGKPSYQYSHSFSSLVAQQYQPSPSHLSPSPSSLGGGGQCDLYKVGFNQDLYFQYIQYKYEMPELKEFTLCFWNKFSNHSNDHPIFSYAVDGQPRAIYSWVSNSERSSYYSLAVEGNTFYRLNYPLRLNRWYHTCQSWNGKTGEWQIWVNAERVGRGFHNRLVGHSIPSGGVAITGQEQSQTGGGFLEGNEAPKGAGGMLGEVTMLQLYSVALTAGKAHRDHKHHHAHKYDHNGAEITTTPSPTPAPRAPQPTHPLLTGGQLNPGVALGIAAQQPQIVQGQQFNPQYLNGQFSSGLVSQQLTGGQGPQTFGLTQPPPQQQPQPQQQYSFQLPQAQPQQLQFAPSSQGQNDITSYSQQSLSIGGRPLLNSGLIHPTGNAQYFDTSSQIETHNLFKRQNKEATQVDTHNLSKRENKEGTQVNTHNLFKRQNQESTRTKRENEKTKRELVLAGGHLIDDSLLSSGFDQSLLDGLAGIGENRPVLQQQMKMEEREPAEAEVKAVMSICSGCDAEPFGKALVFGWRTVAKKLYSGALYTQANTECRVF